MQSEEELQELFEWLDMQQMSDEEIKRILEMREKGGLTREEREILAKCCCN
jgi:hypothetical protein